MANWLGGGESIASGWGRPPELSAPNIGTLVGEILRNRRLREQQTGENIAETIKNVQAYRQREAYTEALRNAGLTQGQDISGLSPATATKLAELIQAQTPDTEMDAYHKALARQANATADYIDKYGTRPGGYMGGSFQDENGVDRAVGETWIGSDGKERIMGPKGNVKLTQLGFQPTDVKTLAPQQAPPISSYLGGQKRSDLDIENAWDSPDLKSKEIPVINPDYDPTDPQSQKYKQRPNPAFKDFQSTPKESPTKTQTLTVPKNVYERWSTGGVGEEEDQPPATSPPSVSPTPPPGALPAATPRPGVADVIKLRQEALKAISEGKDPVKVRQRFHDMTGGVL